MIVLSYVLHLDSSIIVTGYVSTCLLTYSSTSFGVREYERTPHRSTLSSASQSRLTAGQLFFLCLASIRLDSTLSSASDALLAEPTDRGPAFFLCLASIG